jgi:hypothetical protein
MSDLPAPLPDPSESQPRPESGPKDEDRCVVPPHDSPRTETPALEMALAATEGLSDEQRKVMAYLAAGHSIAKAARFGRVSRRTVYRWFKDDADFCAVYNAWQRELTESAKTRLLAMADDAPKNAPRWKNSTANAARRTRSSSRSSSPNGENASVKRRKAAGRMAKFQNRGQGPSPNPIRLNPRNPRMIPTSRPDDSHA